MITHFGGNCASSPPGAVEKNTANGNASKTSCAPTPAIRISTCAVYASRWAAASAAGDAPLSSAANAEAVDFNAAEEAGM